MPTNDKGKKPVPPTGSKGVLLLAYLYRCFDGSKVPSAAGSKQSSTTDVPATKSTLSKVWFIEQGKGGTFMFKGSNSAIGSSRYIGTDGCVTCVGVYFQVGADKCFAAHIDAGVKSMDQTKGTPAELKELKDGVLNKLTQEAKRGGWKKDDIVQKTITVVCTYVEKGPGKAVVDALKDFGLKSFTVQQASGFFIEPGNIANANIVSPKQSIRGNPNLDKNKATGLRAGDWQFGNTSGNQGLGLDWGSDSQGYVSGDISDIGLFVSYGSSNSSGRAGPSQ
ncbi:hypothetical protein LTR37_009443 [Vermiconidia calcicola]|uniref:Uncharacterized protein n=1 Tax=Vermiconidia calcicola TaxID=1690605 RepID=A0ACC3NAH9_9PEZI|nr:hypothetical protein LTR37_009443 [Vermiconidia calcicola]